MRMPTMTRRCLHYSSICLALLWSAWGGSAIRGQPQPAFEAGAAMRTITPDPLLPISGGMGIPSPAKSKQGELTARAMVFRAGSETRSEEHTLNSSHLVISYAVF